MSSGSSGNCQYIETKNAKILIDAGLTGKATVSLLESIGVDPKELDAIFITHEHTDHIAGAGILSRKFNIPIFANGETWQVMAPSLKKIEKVNIKEFNVGEDFYFKDIFIRTLSTFHDAVNPNGYILEDEDCKISIITDTGWINTEILEKIDKSNLYFLESNHDIEMLKNGSYPWPLKQRILSTNGHLSNDNCSEVVKSVFKGRGEILLLSHLSKENNTPDIAYKSMIQTFEEMGLEIEIGAVCLEVAPRYETSKVYDIRRNNENISYK